MRRPTVLLVFGAIFVAELGWSGISPLLPSYADRYGLSDPATGLILTIASLGILLVSLPAGALSRRFAVRSLTLWSMAALAAGNLITGASSTYPVLLFGRCVMGVGLGTMWVAGVAWLHDEAGEHAARALALTTVVVGVASLIGPAITGYLGERFSLGTPFVLLGLLTLAMEGALILAPAERGRTPEPSPPLVEMLRAARGERMMLASLVLTLGVSLMWMTTELLVPLRLDERGYSPADIGLAFSLASCVFIVSSAVTARAADRFATLRVASLWSFVFVAGVAIAAVSRSVPATLVFLVVVGVATGVMISLTYPLGAIGARAGGFSVAVVGAILNMVWAGAGLVGPTGGGAVAGSVGDRVAFAGLAAFGLAAGAWMWVRREPARPGRAAAPERDVTT